MLGKSNLNNLVENSVKKPEALKQVLNINIKKNPNSELNQFVKKANQEYSLQKMELLRAELGIPATNTKTPAVEKELSTEELSQRITDEKEVEEIGRRQQEKIDRYNVSPSELAILAWEDKAKEALKNVEIAESRLALSDQEFEEMFGTMTPDMKEAIPRMLERNKKLVEEYKAIAKGLRTKLER